MTAAEQVLRRCGEAFADGDAAAVGALFAEYCAFEAPLIDRPLTTRDDVIDAATRGRARLEDVELHFEHLAESEGSALAECTLRARTMSGQTIEIGLFAVADVRDGRIDSLTAYLDRRELLG